MVQVMPESEVLKFYLSPQEIYNEHQFNEIHKCMIKCQTKQISIQDKMLKQKDVLLNEAYKLLKVKDEFSDLQAAEMLKL